MGSDELVKSCDPAARDMGLIVLLPSNGWCKMSVKSEATDPLIYKKLAATHIDILSIGAEVEKKRNCVVERERQKAIRSTEEVVRREEETKRLEELAKAADEAMREKELLLEEARKERLIAIAEANATLTTELKRQEEMTIKNIQEANERRLQKALKDAATAASQKQNEAVAAARSEEQELSRKRAERIAQITEERRVEAALQAEEEQRKALKQQQLLLTQKHTAAMEAKQMELQEIHRNEIDKLKQHYGQLLGEVSAKLQQEQGSNHQLTEDLREMTKQKEEWEENYQALKLEFSRFIDQFPGFRGEFILK